MESFLEEHKDYMLAVKSEERDKHVQEGTLESLVIDKTHSSEGSDA